MERPGITNALTRVRRSRGAMIAIFLAGTLLAAVLVIAAVFETAARVPALAGMCGTCHEIAPHVEAWRASSHANTGCRSCHTTYAWYDGFRYRMTHFADDMSRRISGETAPEAPPRRRGATGPIVDTPDAVCLRCHSMAREPSTRDRVIIDHAAHAERNDACLSCHLNTTHPDPETDIVLIMMEQCYECHTLTPAADEPSGECAVCHPEHLELTPASHEPPDMWLRPEHGKSAEVDNTQCMMCHTESSCVDCHGILMPHPPTFAQDHSEIAAAQQEVCGRCHAGQPDPCSTCHHSLESVAITSWETQHYRVTRIQGPAACMRCHGAVFCAQCHQRGTIP